VVYNDADEEGRCVMDRVTTIVGALAAGAANAAEGTDSQAVQDAYRDLTRLILRRFAGKPHAEHVLKKFEEMPQVYTTPLKYELAAVGAAEDQELLTTAMQLQEALTESGEYQGAAWGQGVAPEQESSSGRWRNIIHLDEAEYERSSPPGLPTPVPPDDDEDENDE
jgi:hypothetical protein